MSKTSPLKEKSFLLAVRIVKLHKYLLKEYKAYDLGRQLLRSGTNPGAMVREAFNAESDKDFIHKLGVGQKELGETMFWLELLYKTGYLSDDQFNSLYGDTEEVMKLIRSSIITKKKKMGLLAISLTLVIGSVLYFLQA
ncbi:MAG: four helix bundle protein [Bacteroidota bacterium]